MRSVSIALQVLFKFEAVFHMYIFHCLNHASTNHWCTSSKIPFVFQNMLCNRTSCLLNQVSSFPVFRITGFTVHVYTCNLYNYGP